MELAKPTVRTTPTEQVYTGIQDQMYEFVVPMELEGQSSPTPCLQVVGLVSFTSEKLGEIGLYRRVIKESQG